MVVGSGRQENTVLSDSECTEQVNMVSWFLEKTTSFDAKSDLQHGFQRKLVYEKGT